MKKWLQLVISATTKVILTIEEVITATLKWYKPLQKGSWPLTNYYNQFKSTSATTKVILATEELITATLKSIQITAKGILATSKLAKITLSVAETNL